MESDSLGLRRPLPQAAARLRPDMEPCFELSIGNADKGLLPLEEIKRRVSQFTSSGLPLVVTQAGLAAAAHASSRACNTWPARPRVPRAASSSSSSPHHRHVLPACLPARPACLPQAPLFTQKADLFHDSVFVVGYDTAVRLVKPDYYGSDQAMLLQVG